MNDLIVIELSVGKRKYFSRKDNDFKYVFEFKKRGLIDGFKDIKKIDSGIQEKLAYMFMNMIEEINYNLKRKKLTKKVGKYVGKQKEV